MHRSSTLSLLLALGLGLSGVASEAASGKVILIDDEDSACRLQGTWADNYGNNPEGKNFSGDGTVNNRYRYTSSHGKYARTGKEKAVYTPQLPQDGTYRVEVGFRASENRSPKVTYEVVCADGKHRKTINQRTDDNWADLGTYPFAAGNAGTVAMISDGGQSASVDAVRFTLVEGGKNPSPGTNSGQTGGLGDLLPPSSGDSDSAAAAGKVIRLDHRNPGQKSFSFPADGIIRVSPYLHTFGRARLAVSIKRTTGETEDVIVWSRSHDADPAPLEVNGRAIPESMREVKPGDFSPAAPGTYEFEGKAGDEVQLLLEGSFGFGRPFLRMEFQAK